MQSQRRRDLAAEMNRQRAKLRLTWDQVAQRAGISVATLRRLRNSDDPVTLDTMVGIDEALEWGSGHVEARLAGREPAPLRREHAPPDDELEVLIANARRELARVERALAELEREKQRRISA
jgi:transcriptional regulator with XRE-family HTH domain